jgi:hypothetical protein
VPEDIRYRDPEAVKLQERITKNEKGFVVYMPGMFREVIAGRPVRRLFPKNAYIASWKIQPSATILVATSATSICATGGFWLITKHSSSAKLPKNSGNGRHYTRHTRHTLLTKRPRQLTTLQRCRTSPYPQRASRSQDQSRRLREIE